MKSVFLGICVLIGISHSAQAQYDPFVGQLMIFAGNFCPVGWEQTNGQLLAISQYPALFTILGTTYGGDGRATFALPKTQPIYTTTRATFTECIALEGVFPSRN